MGSFRRVPPRWLRFATRADFGYKLLRGTGPRGSSFGKMPPPKRHRSLSSAFLHAELPDRFSAFTDSHTPSADLRVSRALSFPTIEVERQNQ